MADLVSVIIPTYFRNNLLRKSIESVLSQNYDPIEVIVIDDSGEEAALSIVKDYPEVTYLAHKENRGAPSARATGIHHASGKYIQFLDDDDTLHPTKIEKQVALLEESEAGLVYCGAKSHMGASLPRHRGDVLEQALRFDLGECNTPTMLAERSRYEKLRPLDRYDSAQDVWFKIEIARQTKVDYVDEVLVTIGRPERSLFESPITPICLKEIIADYSEVYNQFPESFRKAAQTKANLLEGNAYLSERWWSIRATYAFWKAFRMAPENKMAHLRPLALSLLGRNGRDFGRWLSHRRGFQGNTKAED